MFKTKKEVDAHVRNALSKIRTESERHLRSLTIAKLYFKINEYATAEQYLISYLSVKGDNDQAHKLLGQCYQRLKKPDKALQAFQDSLQLNPKQPDVLAEVCQLLLEDNHLKNNNKAKYWCELAEAEKVNHEAVFSLRLKLMNTDHLAANQVEELIQKEISASPNDVQLRVRLVRYYVEQNQILDAFKYVHQLEMSQKDEFVTSSEWYNIVWLVLNKYEQMTNIKKDWDFWLLVAMCLERQVSLSFNFKGSANVVGGGVTETANLLFNLDQYLFKISQLADKFCAQPELVQLFLDHYHGQLLLHSSALILKRELLQNKNKWKETTRAILPLLLLAYQIGASDNKEPWMKHCDEQSKLLIGLWQKEGSFRCAQVGRTLLSCINDDLSVDKENAHNINYLFGSQPSGLWQNNEELLIQVRQLCSDRQWRHNIFALLFCNSDQKIKEQSSLLVKSSKLSEPLYELPLFADVERYEDAAQYLRPQSLSHMVYLCLGSDNLAYVRAKYFSGLNFSTHNLSCCGAESLNQLDVDSFLYAATIQAKRALEVDREAFDNYQSGNSFAAGKPKILPFVNIQNILCTEEQSQWWYSAYVVYKNLSAGHNLAELRANLQYGIEAVRGINGPKLDMAIVFKLGQLFVTRAQDIVKPLEKTFLEARAESNYKYGLNMLKMHNKGVLEPFRKYFKYYKSDSAAAQRELTSAAEDAASYLANRYFNKCEYEDLIEELSGIQLPYATYLQAEAYRKLDEASKTPKKTKHLYLERASECLNQTLALLKSSAHVDPNHPLNSIIHSEIKRLQQASARYLNDSNSNYSPLTGHNNSSTYEDAETDFYAGNTILPHSTLFNSTRAKRENLANANHLISTHNQEMENLVKQVTETLKLELGNVTKEISTLKEKISNLEDAVKKIRVNSNPQSRDDASDDVLDELYVLADLDHQTYQQQPQQPTATPHINAPQYANNTGGVTNGPNMLPNSPFLAQQQRLQAAAFNNPMFPPTHNFPINFYGHPTQTNPYLMAPQPAPAPMNQRGAPLPAIPYMDQTIPVPQAGLNFNMPPTTTPLLPTQTQSLPTLGVEPNKPNNLYNLLQQITPNISNPIPPPSMPTYPNNPIPHTSMTMPLPVANPTHVNVNPTMAMQMHKPLSSQPLEKALPANVVITSSDPLPNPNAIAVQSQPQLPLSVTIPSHHIKTSLTNQPPPQVDIGSFSNKAITTLSTTASTTTFAKPTFCFKPQIAAAATHASNTSGIGDTGAKETFNKISDSVASDPHADFKSIIPLQSETEVRTGEEDEEVIFSHRAKLFRNVDKVWKERGIGDIKILKNKDGNSRILMRREQTHKICANHVITPVLTLTAPENENKCFIWEANDFADGSQRLEKFLVRFKLPETAKHFQEAVKNAQNEVRHKAAVPATNEKAAEKSKGVKNTPANSLIASSNAKLNSNCFVTSTPSQKSDNALGFGQPFSSGAITNINSTTTTTQASKSLFSGLNLSTKSSGSINDTANKPEANTAIAPSPFANFTFGKPQTLSTTTSTSTTQPNLASTVAKTSNNNMASPFASIFSNLSTSPFTNISSSTTPSFVPTKANEAATSTALNKSSTSDAEDDYVPTAQFNPVIPLPDLVEVNTGEENELVLFEHRAKLLRFDKEAGEWKERGLGIIKLLQDKENVNNVRLVMRREQIYKLCCNQRVYKDTTFKYTKNSDTALSWAGQDFSENELVTEMLTVRFKLPETCKEFLRAIQQAQAKMNGDGEEATSKANETKTQLTETKPIKGFGDAFKAKAGSWSCESCYILNKPEDLHCIACNTPKEKTVPKKETTSDILTTNSGNKFSFGFGATTPVQSVETKSNEVKVGFGEAFKPKPGSWVCQGCYLSNASDVVYCTACQGPKDDTVPKKENNANILTLSNPSQKFNFGFTSSASTTNAPTPIDTSNKPGFSFSSIPAVSSDNAAQSFTFTPPSSIVTTLNSTLPANTNASAISSSCAAIGKSTFSFSLSSKAMEAPAESTLNNFSLDKKDFSFSLKPKSPGKTGKSPLKFGGGDADVAAEDDNESDLNEEEENNTYFTPVIPLPDKIEVKTGEEDEELLYIHRVKLYRFVDGEWKERGLGNIKILRHKENKKLRVVMRREQVLKICLNHALNEDVSYKLKDDKSWMFAANDFSEGTVELKNFSLRFKTKEIAEEFMKKVKEALAGTAEAIDTSIKTTPNAHSGVNGLAISEEDKQMANKLKLPYEFFTTKTECPGCRGCVPDEFEFPDVAKCETFVNKEDIENQLLVMELPDLTDTKPTPTQNLPKKCTLTASVLNIDNTKSNDSSTENAKAFNTQGSGGFLFGSSTISTTNSALGGSKETESGFGNNLWACATGKALSTDKTEAKSIFGGSGTTSGLIFGGKPLFGTAVPSFGALSTTDSNNSIFGNSLNAAQGVSGNSIFGSSINKAGFAGFGSINKPLAKFDSSASTNSTSSVTGNTTFADLAKTSTAAIDFSTLAAEANLSSTKASEKSMASLADLSNTSTASIDFATLAKGSANTPSLGQKLNENVTPGGFIGLTHQNAFSTFEKAKTESNTTDNANDSHKSNDGAREDNYDPYYDPIIELPDEIVVSTGEEEETKVFGERVTLYRFDNVNKEWKERGIGELKLLYHPSKQTYRLVMRREIIHKLVINHAINGDFIFKNMEKSPKSISWATINYAESNEGEVESLTVRFKKLELATAFCDKLNEAVQNAKKRETSSTA